jgi:hypothetical protein
MAQPDWAAQRVDAHIAPILRLVQASLIFDYTHKPGSPYYPLGLLDFALLAIAVTALFRQVRTRQALTLSLALFVGLAFGSLFMVSDLSLPLWRNLAGALAFVQFPWRLMVPAALGISLATAIALRAHARLALLILPALMIAAMPGLPYDPYEAPGTGLPDMWRFEFRSHTIGTTVDNEFTPQWVAVPIPRIPYPADRSLSPLSPAQPHLQLLSASYTRRLYRVTAASPSTLRLHQFYLPQWGATLDGKSLQTYPSTDMGLLSVDVPETTGGLLNLDFGASEAETWGAVISLLTLAAFACYLWNPYFLGALAIVALAVSGIQPLTVEPTHILPVNARFENVADLVAATVDKVKVQPGDSVQVTLYWRAQRDIAEDLKAFVHAEDDATSRRVAQSDSAPAHGFTPTSRWYRGEVIEDVRTMMIPSDAAAGVVRLYAGLYRLRPLKNLEAIQDDLPAPDGRVLIGEIYVANR